MTIFFDKALSKLKARTAVLDSVLKGICLLQIQTNAQIGMLFKKV